MKNKEYGLNHIRHDISANLEPQFRTIGSHQDEAGQIEPCRCAELKTETQHKQLRVKMPLPYI